MAAPVTLPPGSRMKDTPVVEVDGVVMFGLFMLPAEFDDPSSDPRTTYDTVGEAEAPFLDAVAVRNYGPGNESAWWVLAAGSGVIDIDRDAAAGTRIAVPAFDVLNAFRTRAPATTEE